jgi:hypothetical protein
MDLWIDGKEWGRRENGVEIWMEDGLELGDREEEKEVSHFCSRLYLPLMLTIPFSSTYTLLSSHLGHAQLTWRYEYSEDINGCFSYKSCFPNNIFAVISCRNSLLCVLLLLTARIQPQGNVVELTRIESATRCSPRLPCCAPHTIVTSNYEIPQAGSSPIWSTCKVRSTTRNNQPLKQDVCLLRGRESMGGWEMYRLLSENVALKWAGWKVTQNLLNFLFWQFFIKIKTFSLSEW